MTQLTSLAMNTEDLEAEDIAAQMVKKNQQQQPESSIAPNFSLPTQTTGSESSSPNDNKDKPTPITEGDEDNQDGKTKSGVTPQNSSGPPP